MFCVSHASRFLSPPLWVSYSVTAVPQTYSGSESLYPQTAAWLVMLWTGTSSRATHWMPLRKHEYHRWWTCDPLRVRGSHDTLNYSWNVFWKQSESSDFVRSKKLHLFSTCPPSLSTCLAIGRTLSSKRPPHAHTRKGRVVTHNTGAMRSRAEDAPMRQITALNRTWTSATLI